MDLVLRARARAHQLDSRRPSRRRNTRQRSSGIHTDSSSPDHNNCASVRASSRSVFARARVMPVTSGLTTTTRSTCGSRIRAISQQLPVTSNATRSDRTRFAASVKPSAVLGTRPALRCRPGRPHRSRPRRSHGEHQGQSLGQPTSQKPSSPPNMWWTLSARTSGTTTHTDTCSSTIQTSRRGGRTKSPGSKPIAQTGLPACVLPPEPLSRIARPYGRTRTEPPRSIFMPRQAAPCVAISVRQCERLNAAGVADLGAIP